MDVDEHGVEQVLELAGIRLEPRLVRLEIVDADRFHAQRDPAHQAGALVATEIQPATFLDMVQEGFELRVQRRLVGHRIFQVVRMRARPYGRQEWNALQARKSRVSLQAAHYKGTRQRSARCHRCRTKE